MTMDYELIRKLAHNYFADSILEDLRDYLFDRYGEESLEGDLSPQFFFPALIADLESYVHGVLDTAVRTQQQKLQERYEEASGIVSRFSEDIKQLASESQYYADFIHWMHLYDKYQEFRITAHKERDIFGFSYYTV